MARTITVTYANTQRSYLDDEPDTISVGTDTFDGKDAGMAFQMWQEVTDAEIVYVEDSALEYPALGTMSMDDM